MNISRTLTWIVTPLLLLILVAGGVLTHADPSHAQPYMPGIAGENPCDSLPEITFAGYNVDVTEDQQIFYKGSFDDLPEVISNPVFYPIPDSADRQETGYGYTYGWISEDNQITSGTGVWDVSPEGPFWTPYILGSEGYTKTISLGTVERGQPFCLRAIDNQEERPIKVYIDTGEGRRVYQGTMPDNTMVSTLLAEGATTAGEVLVVTSESGLVWYHTEPLEQETPTPTPTMEESPTPVLTPTPGETPVETPVITPTIEPTQTPEALGTVGDYVWLDTDEDGIQDPEESGIGGVQVCLMADDAAQAYAASIVTDPETGEQYATAASAIVVGCTTTDENGIYLFEEVESGQLWLDFQVLDGYELSPMNAGSEANDSDAHASGLTDEFILEEGERDLTRDMGLFVAAPANLKDDGEEPVLKLDNTIFLPVIQQ